ncbi:MAG: TCR/Tet family MFS transporter [Alphaproteobacteria bacterium]|nr:TCR/Tet family MFS transporter [Alphaproteobacteria bacterium]
MTGTAAPTATRAAVAFVFITLMLDVLAMGVVIPVLPKLIEGFMAGAPADAVRIGGWLGVVWALMQFVFTPIQGALSDRFGRRPVLLLSMTGLGLDYILMALAPNLAWLFVARAISGMTAASFGTANAYIADITPPEKRPAAFGLMGAAFGIGFVLGPALGGYAGSFDPRLPFWVAAGLSLLNAAYGFFILPESLPPERRSTKLTFANANVFGSFRLLASNTQLAGLATAQFFYMVAHNVYPTVFVWFTMYRYGWDEKTNGLALAATGVASIVVQGGLVGPVVKFLGARRSIITGLMFGITGFLIYAVGPTSTSIWIAIPIGALWGLYGPAAQSLMTQSVSPSEQGRLQGALGSLMGIASIIAPILYPRVFAAAIELNDASPMPGAPLLGAPFFVAAFLLFCGLIIAWRVTRPQAAPSATP